MESTVDGCVSTLFSETVTIRYKLYGLMYEFVYTDPKQLQCTVVS